MGLAITVLGLLLLLPLADYLPVDLRLKLSQLLSGSSPQSTFFRVVSGEPSRVLEGTLVGVGLLLVAVAEYLRQARK